MNPIRRPIAATTSSSLLALAAMLAALVATMLAALPRTAAAQEAAEWVYQVVPGDTLIGLTAAYLRPGVPWQQLQRRNQIADPYRLPPGKVLRIPIDWLRAEAAVAEAVHVRGDVRLARDGAESALQPGDTGLRSADTVRTGTQSSASLRFADGSRVLIGPDSVVQLQRLMVLGRSGVADTRLRVERGSAESVVPPAGAAVAGPRYRVETPSMNLGVRGTEFRARHAASNGTSQVEVLSGRVGAAGTRGGTLAVEAGFGTDAAPGAAAGLPRRLLPAPDLAAMPAPIDRLPIRAHWPAQPGAQAYRAQVLAEGPGEALVLDGVFAEPAAHWPDLPDGRYRLRVRGVDASGLEGRHAQVEFGLKARPQPPFMREPRSGQQLHGDEVAFAWTVHGAADRYRLQVLPDEAGAAPVADLPGLAAASRPVRLAPGRYRWRVASVAGAADQGPWSDAVPFELRALPGPPQADPPGVAAGALVLRWNAVPGVTYQVQVAADPSFESPWVDRTLDQGALSLPDARPGTYHLRVRALDGHVPGPWGPVQQAEVAPPRWWLLLPLVLILLL